MRRISMRDLAKASGFSLATVSYSLRGHAKISVETRQKVLDLAARMGYQPDPSFAVLGARRWERQSTYNGLSIAYIAPAAAQWTRFQKDCFTGAREHADELGYHLQHFCRDDFKNPAHLGEVLEHRGFQGVILRRINNPADLDGFPLQRFSVLACGRGSVDPNCHIIMPHHQHNLQLAWQRLRDKGHQRIGCILLEHDDLAELPEFYIGAFLQAQRSVATKHRVPILSCTNNQQIQQPQQTQQTQQQPQSQLAAWLQRWQPQAIIGCVDRVWQWIQAEAPYFKQAHEQAFSLPDFISLEKANPHDPKISGINLRPHMMGSVAVAQIDLAIRANERGLPSLRHTILIEAS